MCCWIQLCFVISLVTVTNQSNAQDWADVFDPNQMLALNLEMEQSDWETIQHDETLSIEVPAMFWIDGEKPILIAVRRKSADPINEGTSFDKVSLKIDINELVSGQMWHGLRKLSIENGDDEDVVAEGMAWHLHRLASGSEGYGYTPGLAAWVTLHINGINTGVYLNVEQPDKRYLQNRKTYIADQTWLYKVSDPNQPDRKVGGPQDSPTYDELCFLPFVDNCSAPDPTVLAKLLPKWVDMQGLLTLGALCQFGSGGDAIFTAGKNFYFADFTFGLTRRYYPWDLDSHIPGGGMNYDIYAGNAEYASLLSIPEFRTHYSQILNDLICGPMSEEVFLAFIDSAETLISTALEADVNNQLEETVAERFDFLRSWFSQRYASVISQIEGYEPCASNPSDINEDGIVNVTDLLILIGAWGPCDEPCLQDCLGDINNDCVVDVADILIMLGDWG